MRSPANIQAILDKLTHVKPMGTGKWQADCPCPGHDSPGGHLSLLDTGTKCLVRCFNTHSFADVCKALEFDTLSYTVNPAHPAKRIVRSFNYEDVDGNLLYQVLRYEPKSFGVRRPDGQGGWIYKLAPVKPVLYHLPDILVARIYDHTVYVCEGERDADNAGIYYGTVGTTSPFGAGKWCEDYPRSLYGLRITIIPDNDEVGKRHCLDIVRSLQGKVKSLEIQQVPQPHKDFTEWLVSEKLLESVI